MSDALAIDLEEEMGGGKSVRQSLHIWASQEARSYKPVGFDVIKRQSVMQIDTGAILESLVRSRHYVPPGAPRIHTREELPLALQSHTHEVDSMIWRAWHDGRRIWFVKAKPVRCEDAAGLQVLFFDMDGRLASSGVWIWVAHRGWVLSHPSPAM